MKLQCLDCGWTENEPFDVEDACICGGVLTPVAANDWRKFFYRWPLEFAAPRQRRHRHFWRAVGIFLLWLLAVLMAALAAYAGTGM